MKIVYSNPDDTEQFDLNRYVSCLKRYDSTISEDIVNDALKGLPYDPMHVSVLVETGIKLIKDEEASKRYYDEHKDWFDMNNFERLRRITGYLVGSLERWNDGKRAEEKARVKHSVGQYDLDEKARIEAEKLANSIASQI